MNRTLYQGIEALRAPKYLRDFIRARGGSNLYGEPNYRLVRALGRTRLSAGRWHEWPKGTPIVERDPLVNTCWRSWVGTRPVPMYPGETGWALERWFPPREYGMTPQQWYRPIAEGGTMKWVDHRLWPSVGLYPHQGDYESTNFYLPNDACTEAIVGAIIGAIEHRLADIPSPQQRVVEQMAAGAAEEERLETEYQKFAEEQLGEAMEEGPWLDAWSAGGQAEANKMIEKVKQGQKLTGTNRAKDRKILGEYAQRFGI